MAGVKVLSSIGRFFKNKWKLLVCLLAVALLVIGGILGYDYYKNTYIPEKRLNEAIQDIEKKFHSEVDSTKYEYAYRILKVGYEWDFENIDNNCIYDRLTKHQDEAFKYIEDQAYDGNAKCQFLLGQIYCWGEERYHYKTKDLVKAAYWWNEAAQQGYVKSYNNLGIAYKEGYGVSIDLRKAVKYLKMGSEAGDDWAQRNYGDLFVEGVKVKCGSHIEHVKSVTNVLTEDKVREYYDSQSGQWIYVYRRSIDDYETLIPKDIEQAKYWWREAAIQGNEQAKEKLQKIYE